jgi:hypothetical protein
VFAAKEGVCVLIIVSVYLRITYYYYSYLKELKKDGNTLVLQFNSTHNFDSDKRATNSQLILNFKEIEVSVKKSIRKIYIIIAIYLLEFMFTIGVQTAYNIKEAFPGTVMDNILTLAFNLTPLTNPLFILFFHDETNYEMQSVFSLIRFKFLKKFNQNK